MKARQAGASLALLALLVLPAGSRAAGAGDVLPVPPLRLPEAAERQLANGLRVVVFSRPLSGIVEMRVIVPAGGRAEPDSIPGLAAFTAGMLRAGTASRTAGQFDAELDAIGATFSAGSGHDFAVAAVTAPATGFEPALELLSDAVIAPRFDPDEFDAARRRAAQRLGASRGDPAAIADNQLWDAAFSPHPYGHPPEGDIQSLMTLSLADVSGFGHAHWRPDRATLAIAGDVTPGRAFAAAQEWFDRWAGHVAPEPQRAVMPIKPVLRVVDLPGATWSEIRVAVRGPGRASGDLSAWRLAAASLESALRPAGVGVALSVMREASLLVLSVGAPPDSAAARVAMLRGALHGFGASPPAGDSLAALRLRLAQGAPLDIETLAGWLGQWQAAADAGLTESTFEHEFCPDEPARLGGVAAAARALLAAPQLVVVAGPGSALSAALAQQGRVQVVPFEKPLIAPPDTLPAAGPLELGRGRAAVAAAVLAHGGAARLNAVHASQVHGELSIYENGRELTGLLTVLRVDPARLHYQTQTDQFTTRQVLDGDHGWDFSQGDSAHVEDLDSSGVATLRLTREDDLIHVLRRASAAGSRAALRGQGKVGLRTCDLVDFRGPGGVPMRIAIDALTHRVLAVDTGLGPRGVWQAHRELSDFRPLRGLLLPYEEVRFAGGEIASRFHARTIELDPKVDEAVFRKPHVISGQDVDR